VLRQSVDDVRCSAAVKGKPDMSRTWHFGALEPLPTFTLSIGPQAASASLKKSFWRDGRELLPKRMDVVMVADAHGFDKAVPVQNGIHHAIKAWRVIIVEERYEHASLPIRHHGSPRTSARITPIRAISVKPSIPVMLQRVTLPMFTDGVKTGRH
jgi:hypothetical protein